MNKITVLTILETMDEQFEMEELINKLLFVRDIDLGLKDVQEDRISNYIDVKQKFRYDH